MTTSNPFAAALSGQRKVYTDRRPAPMQVTDTASERQLDYIGDLLVSRRFDLETRPKYRARVHALVSREAQAQLTREQASAFIDYLNTLPKAERPAAVKVGEVPAGRYAVEVGETLAFVQVDRPEEGRWAGYTFVTRQLADEFVRVSRHQAATILEAIKAVGPAEASKRYGREIGECGICHRTLTNEDSRANGIGPQCAKKIGW